MRTWIWMDVSATCNLKCELCYTIELQEARKMTMSTFEAVVGNVLESSLDLVSIHLNWRGEPTSNRLLPDMIAHLAGLGVDDRVEWHTNGTLISRARATRLVEASDRQTVFVSLDGGTAESFEATPRPRQLGSRARRAGGHA